MTAHRIVVARISPDAQSGACSCGKPLIAKQPRTLADVLKIHCEKVRRREELKELTSFIDAHGGRLGAFRGYQPRRET